MVHDIFIGVDGGATKTTVKVEDAAGNVLGLELGGPANIRLSVKQAWSSILETLDKILTPLSISLTDPNYHFHVGMGLAGCEIKEAYQEFLNHPHLFKTLVIVSDAHIACLGAHGGQDGAIIIIGTGVVGYQIHSGITHKIGGWGFPHDDEGGGAWLGLEAMKVTLRWLDNRYPVSGIAKAVYASFANDKERMVAWANLANSTGFAGLAPLIIREAQSGDSQSQELLKQSAQWIDLVGNALIQTMPFPRSFKCALVGGLAPFIKPHLSLVLTSQLVPCVSSPEAGAILLVRHHLKMNKEKYA